MRLWMTVFVAVAICGLICVTVWLDLLCVLAVVPTASLRDDLRCWGRNNIRPCRIVDWTWG